jgi:hypothetical protein
MIPLVIPLSNNIVMDIFADIAPLTGEEGIRDDIVLKKRFFLD